MPGSDSYSDESFEDYDDDSFEEFDESPGNATSPRPPAARQAEVSARDLLRAQHLRHVAAPALPRRRFNVSLT